MDEIYWTDTALQDLDDIGTYIAADSPAAAENVVRRIVETVAVLTYQPRMGRIGRDEATRELVVQRTPYIAVLQAPRADRDHYDLPLGPKVAGLLRIAPGRR